jgi:hypothetical protein
MSVVSINLLIEGLQRGKLGLAVRVGRVHIGRNHGTRALSGRGSADQRHADSYYLVFLERSRSVEEIQKRIQGRLRSV